MPGDTLASALLANGVRLIGRSFKYHRPRGVLGAGVEEPNALVGVGSGGRFEPNTRATESSFTRVSPPSARTAGRASTWTSGRWPSSSRRSSPPASTTRPSSAARKLWAFYERFIRRAAGLGQPPTEAEVGRLRAPGRVLRRAGGRRGTGGARRRQGRRPGRDAGDPGRAGCAARRGTAARRRDGGRRGRGGLGARRRSPGSRAWRPGPRPDHGGGVLRPRPGQSGGAAGRGGATAGRRRRSTHLACPGEAGGAGPGRHRAADAVRRQRPAGRDAGLGGANLRIALWGAAGAAGGGRRLRRPCLPDGPRPGGRRRGHRRRARRPRRGARPARRRRAAALPLPPRCSGPRGAWSAVGPRGAAGGAGPDADSSTAT